MIEKIDLATFAVLKQWNSRSKNIRSEVSIYIDTQLAPFLEYVSEHTLPNDAADLFRCLLDKRINFCDNSGTYKFFVQITVFHEKSGTFLCSIPQTFDESRLQLFFLGNFNEGNLEISDVIINIHTFFNKFGYYCFFCQKCYKGRGTQHKCARRVSCFVCKRPYLSPNISPTNFNSTYFCLSSQTASVAKRCDKCNLRIQSDQCRDNHFKKICRFGWLCTVCEKYSVRSRFFPTIESIRNNHVCGIRTCHFCGERKGLGHQCHLTATKVSNSLTRLGFMDVQFTGRSSISCENCFLKSKNGESISCAFCKDNERIKDNVCTILYETKREYFAKKVFASFSFSFPKENSTALHFPYLPSNYIAPACEKKTYFNKVRTSRLSDSAFKPKNKSPSVLAQMLNFLLKNKIRHTTFLVHDRENTGILNELLKVLMKFGVLPNIVGTPHIRLLEIVDLGLRFLNSTDYSNQSHFCFFKKFHEAPVFFPQKWNKESFYEYVGSSPTKSDIFNVEDTQAVLTEKENFVNKTMSDTWCFKKEILNFSEKVVVIIARAFLSFIEEAFQCQEFLFMQLQPSKTEKEYIMPFNPPLFTRASYAFALLLKFSSIEEIRTESEPIRMSSSKQEIEFCSFLRSQFPNHTFVDAWSPFGQKKFSESFPDSFCENSKTAYYFNGCLIHGHPKEKCLFQRKSANTLNYFKVPLAEAYANHEKKCKQLLQNHPKDILYTYTMWECEWFQKKKTDKKLQQFLLKIYKEPPLYRLDSKFAVRGGINELYACHFRLDKEEQYCFSFADLISSYPFSAMQELPLGEYEVSRIDIKKEFQTYSFFIADTHRSPQPYFL